MNEGIKETIIAIIILVCSMALIIYGLYAWMNYDNKRLNICAREYEFKERTILEGAGQTLVYIFEYFNETTFACCLKQDYIYNGEIKHLNCTSLHNKTELKEIQNK